MHLKELIIEIYVSLVVRCIKLSDINWTSNIEPLNTSVDGSEAQESNSVYFFIVKIGVKTLPSEVITDLDPRKRMNLASSVLGESPKFIDFGLSPFNAMGKPNPVFSPSTRAESLKGTGGGSLNDDWIASSHGFERARNTKAYSNHIKNSELETRNIFERENIQTENIPL